MFSKLLLPLYLAALARGDHDAEDVSALEPQVFDSELKADLFEEALEPEVSNTTYNQRSNVGGSKFGAYIERVDFNWCPNYAKYLPHFYEGLVVNSRAWKTKGNERFTSVALTDSINQISSSAGAIPPINDQLFHTWEMLDMNKVSTDIRRSVPNKIYYWTWNAMQQIYIPLYLNEVDEGEAYMLHIYPESSFLLNPPSDTVFTESLVWAKGNTNRMYKLEIDIEGMIRNLDNFSVPDYKKYITSWGVAFINDGSTQSAVAFPDHRQLSLRKTTLYYSTEHICGGWSWSMDMTWPEMQSLLRKEFSWL